MPLMWFIEIVLLTFVIFFLSSYIAKVGDLKGFQQKQLAADVSLLLDEMQEAPGLVYVNYPQTTNGASLQIRDYSVLVYEKGGSTQDESKNALFTTGLTDGISYSFFPRKGMVIDQGRFEPEENPQRRESFSSRYLTAYDSYISKGGSNNELPPEQDISLYFMKDHSAIDISESAIRFVNRVYCETSDSVFERVVYIKDQNNKNFYDSFQSLRNVIMLDSYYADPSAYLDSLVVYLILNEEDENYIKVYYNGLSSDYENVRGASCTLVNVLAEALEWENIHTASVPLNMVKLKEKVNLDSVSGDLIVVEIQKDERMDIDDYDAVRVAMVNSLKQISIS
jgi:hypothetical protein